MDLICTMLRGVCIGLGKVAIGIQAQRERTQSACLYWLMLPVFYVFFYLHMLFFRVTFALQDWRIKRQAERLKANRETQ